MSEQENSERLELELGTYGYISAVTRRRADGSIIWRLTPPGGLQDTFSSLKCSPSQIVAFSWSCWLIEVDALTGVEMTRTFTK